MGSWDGSRIGDYGPDLFEMGLDNYPCFFRTSFQNSQSVSWERTQSYPEGFPFGHNPARTGAALNLHLTQDTSHSEDSVYRITRVILHHSNRAEFIFRAYGLESIQNESWGLANVRVRAIMTPATEKRKKIKHQ